jgi:hypothetical protein
MTMSELYKRKCHDAGVFYNCRPQEKKRQAFLGLPPGITLQM